MLAIMYTFVYAMVYVFFLTHCIWLAHMEFELGNPGSIPGSCHYSNV